jgi:hypothetical protein
MDDKGVEECGFDSSSSELGQMARYFDRDINSVFLKLIRLVKIYLHKTYSKVRLGKYLSDKFPIQNYLKQGDVL